jgi:hypothetical protein
MNRLHFIKKLFGTGALMLLPFQVQKRKNSSLLLRFKVAGFQFYKGEKLMDTMQAGQALTIHREPENPHDRHAIAIYYRNEKIGFVPRSKNEVLSRLIDLDSSRISAEIIEVRSADNPWDAVAAAIYLNS